MPSTGGRRRISRAGSREPMLIAGLQAVSSSALRWQSSDRFDSTGCAIAAVSLSNLTNKSANKLNKSTEKSLYPEKEHSRVASRISLGFPHCQLHRPLVHSSVLAATCRSSMKLRLVSFTFSAAHLPKSRLPRNSQSGDSLVQPSQ